MRTEKSGVWKGLDLARYKRQNCRYACVCEGLDVKALRKAQRPMWQTTEQSRLSEDEK